jgi:hypothetical protein
VNEYVTDPFLNPYFAPQELGSGQFTAGSGNGYGFLDWTKVPGFERFAQDMSAGVSGGPGENIARTLSEGGFKVHDQDLGNNMIRRGIVGSDGQVLGGFQDMQRSNDNGFWKAGLLAAALTGGAVANWANAGSGLGAIGDAGGVVDAIGGLGGESGAATIGEGLFSGADGFLTPALEGGIGASYGAQIPALSSGLLGTGAAVGVPALGGGSFLDKLGSAASTVVDKLKENPLLGRAVFGGLGGLLGGAGGQSGGGGYSYDGPMPTISRQGWSPSATPTYKQPEQAPVLNTQPGQANSGLWRFIK